MVSLVLLFPSHTVLVSVLCWLYQEHKLLLAPASLSCSRIFQFPGNLGYLSFFSDSFNFTLWSARTAKSIFRQILFFLLISRSGRLVEIMWSVLLLSLLLLFPLFEDFSHQRKLIDFHRSLSDSKSPQVSWTHQSILAGLNNIVV